MRPTRREYENLLSSEVLRRLLGGDARDLALTIRDGKLVLVEVVDGDDDDLWPLPWLGGIDRDLRGVEFRSVDHETGEANDPIIAEPLRSHLRQIIAEEWRRWSCNAAVLELIARC